MGHLTFALNVTLDGCCDHREGVVDDEMHRYWTRAMDSTGAMLFGRRTYELMESAWPQVARDPKAPPSDRRWARKLEAKPKYVVSTTRRDFPWSNTHRVEGDLARAVRALEEGHAARADGGEPHALGRAAAAGPRGRIPPGDPPRGGRARPVPVRRRAALPAPEAGGHEAAQVRHRGAALSAAVGVGRAMPLRGFQRRSRGGALVALRVLETLPDLDDSFRGYWGSGRTPAAARCYKSGRQDLRQ